MSAPQFGHIDVSDPHDAPYARDTQGRAYMILWRDDTISEDEARAIGAVPITERFPGQEGAIPPEYLHAWCGTVEPWSL